MASKLSTQEQEKLGLSYLETMRSLIYSDLCVKTVEDIKDKDIVIFIGNTRAGKSTIVNYIIGNKMNAVFQKKKFTIIPSDDSGIGPVIGTKSVSQTTIPTAWNSNKIKGIAVDAPGFNDNRGVAQDVANAFYIKKIITSAKSIKIVIITDINDILGDNVNNFISFVDKVYTIFPNFNHLLKGVLVVFNKDKDDTTKEEMIDTLQAKIISEGDIDLKNRGLVSHLIKYTNHFIIGPTPIEEGPCEYVFEGVDRSIEEVAETIPMTLLSNITPGISYKSKAFLYEAHNHLIEMKELDEVIAKIKGIFENESLPSDINKKSQDELRMMKRNIMMFVEKFGSLSRTQASTKTLLSSIGKVLPNINELKEGGILYVKIEFLEFLDSILGTKQNNILTFKINALLVSMKDNSMLRMIRVQEALFEINADEAKQQYVSLMAQYKSFQDKMDQQINELKKQNEELAKQRKGCTIL